MLNDVSNTKQIRLAFDKLHAVLLNCVTAEMKRLRRDSWRPRPNFDVQQLITIILDQQVNGFTSLRTPNVWNLILEVGQIRQDHVRGQDFSEREVNCALDTIALLMEAIDSPEVLTTQPVSQRAVPVATKSNQHPGAADTGRGGRLFRYLAAKANSGDAVGIGYAGFVVFLHGKSYHDVMGRAYAQSDTNSVIELSYTITDSVGRIDVTNGGATLKAGMDTFIWPLKKGHERSPGAWNHPSHHLPYSREQWRRVFPDGARRLITARELEALVK